MKNKTEVKHTPTPWVLGPNGLDVREGKHEDALFTMPYQDHIASETVEANAAFIVRAVNSHDALVEAVKTLHHTFGNDHIGSDKCKFCAVLKSAGAL